MSDPWLSFAEFKARSVIPAVSLDAMTRLRWRKGNADDAADTTTPETKFADVVVTGSAQSVTVTVDEAVAADGTDYATITVSKRTAGGPPVVVASLATSATDLPAGVPVALTIADASLTAEDMLTVSIGKSGAGVEMPELAIDVRPTPTFVEARLAQIQALIEARLRKRYAIPFEEEVPETCKQWLVAIATPEIWPKLGWNPSSEQDATLIEDRKNALEEIKEAANSEIALFELPLRQDIDPDRNGVVKGGPLGYSEQSPYVGFDRQFEAGSYEDSQGTGSGDQ